MSSLIYAIASYLNAAPMGEGLYNRDDVEVVNNDPSRLFEMVKSGQADAGLMPIVDHLFDPDLQILDGMGVCACGKVRSVLLRCRCPVKDVKVVLADRASHTSNLLARLVLKVRFGVDVVVKHGIDVTDADAEVIIGDRALTAVSGLEQDYDLAEEWNIMTALPFVFAAWTYMKGNERVDQLTQIAKESLDVGLARKDEIALRYSEKLSLPLSLCREYLDTCVYYTVGELEKAGIAEFARMLREHNLAPAGKESV